MTHNAKNYRRHQEAKERSKTRQNGNPGPAKTLPKHGKKWTYRSNPEIQKRLAEAVKAMTERKTKKTVLEKINDEKEVTQRREPRAPRRSQVEAE